MFAGFADFSRVRFHTADFSGVAFEQGVSFADASVLDKPGGVARKRLAASFRGAHFAGPTDFSNARFAVETRFDGAVVAGPARFRGTVFDFEARFDEVSFAELRSLGPVYAPGSISFGEASFSRPVRIEIAAHELRFARTHFEGRAELRLRYADVAFDEADFVNGGRVLGEPRPFERSDEDEAFDETRLREWRESPDGVRSGEIPRVVSVRGANVAGVTFADVDLRACRFVGAQGLDQLRLEGGVAFASTPRGRRWTRRQALAEEHHWRAEAASRRWGPFWGPLGRHVAATRGRGWYPAGCRPPEWLAERVWRAREFEPPRVPRPLDVAAAYRSLRKGREDARDEPGGGDFYYGEMEMRRGASKRVVHARGEQSADDEPARHTPVAERTILWWYWLTSGYGLRVSRALIGLLVTIALFAGLFAVTDSIPDSSFSDTLLFSAESTISLLRAPERELTDLGRVLQVMLRLLGPLFFGLAILAARGRIRR